MALLAANDKAAVWTTPWWSPLLTEGDLVQVLHYTEDNQWEEEALTHSNTAQCSWLQAQHMFCTAQEPLCRTEQQERGCWWWLTQTKSHQEMFQWQQKQQNSFLLLSPSGVFWMAAHPKSGSSALTSQPLCYSIHRLAAGFASLPCPSPHAHTAPRQGFSSLLHHLKHTNCVCGTGSACRIKEMAAGLIMFLPCHKLSKRS